jgi:RNA polymerase sigma factor (sigma-70 family)
VTDSVGRTADLPAVGDLSHSVRLVRRFREGDRSALDELFARYYDRVNRIARIRMGSRLRRLTESDDIVQETFAIALGKIDKVELRDHSSIIQYLSRVLEHQIKDAVEYFGAQKRDRRGDESLAARESAGEPEPVDRAPLPPEQLEARELKELYDDCVQSLGADQREVILLREYANASWPEITALLGRPTEHATQELYGRAQIKLASCLRRKLGE